ncbi:MAG: DNA repair protein RecO [bacterium]
MPPVKSAALVLSSRQYRDTSRIICFYSQAAGRVDCVAKGVLTARAKTMTALEPLSLVEIIYYSRSSNGLHTLAQSAYLDPFPGIRGDLIKTAFASVISEMLKTLFFLQEQNTRLFDLSVAFMKNLSGLEKDNIISNSYFLLWLFIIHMLRFAGLSFSDNICVKCDTGDETQLSGFSVPHGGFICGKCAKQQMHTVSISRDCYCLLRDLNTRRFSFFKDKALAIEPDFITGLLINFLKYHMGKDIRLKSLDFLYGLVEKDRK